MRERKSKPDEVKCPSILTTHHKRFHPAWVERTVLLPGWYEAFERANGSYWRSFYWALRLFRESRKFDAVVTGAEHCGMMFALLQTLFRPRSRRSVHVMIDFPWAACPGRLRLAFKSLQMRLAAPSLDAIFAHASPEEAERFTAALHVRQGLFRFVPFHYWIEEPLPETRCGDYIFSGGNFGRDYPTLLRALSGTSYPTILCTQVDSALRNHPIPANVQVMGISQARFDELMAGAAAVVLPLMTDDIHPGGHTVALTAMRLGKPLILAAPPEYRSYVEDGVTAVLTPAGDSVRLRDAIARVLGDREFARRLGHNAAQASRRFSPEKFFAQVFQCVEQALAERSGDRESLAEESTR